MHDLKLADILTFACCFSENNNYDGEFDESSRLLQNIENTEDVEKVKTKGTSLFWRSILGFLMGIFSALLVSGE